MAKIIFIDEKEAIRRLYLEELEDWGHKMIILKNHVGLLGVIKTQKPDIVILGVRPIGYDWQKMLMAIHELYPNLLIIFNTSLIDLWEEAVKLGAKACFDKSADLTHLKEIIDKIMAARK
jgi:DNA-binding NtrC family response regulator